MIYPKCLAILGFIVTSVFCNSTVSIVRVELKDGHVTVATENMATVVSTTPKIPINLQVLRPPLNDTTNISSTVKTISGGRKRVVVFINSRQMSHQNGSKNEKPVDPETATVQNLLYVEYSDDGTVLAEFMMNNMEDVSKFFELFLHTKICRGSCPTT